MIDNLLLCVGAQKTGTTWLHSQLKDHPQIGFSDVKEVHYFNTIHNGSVLLTTRKVEHLKNLIENNRFALENYFTRLSQGKKTDKGIEKLLSPVNDEWYMNHLKTEKKYAADFTPEYALLPNEGFENIKKVSRNQKVIFIMRDPIERAKSAIQYYFQTNGKDIESSTEEEILSVAQKSFIIKMSSYQDTIRKLESNFSIDNVLYMFYEDIMANKEESINVVYGFLGISAVEIDSNRIQSRVNSSKKFNFSNKVNDYLSNALTETYDFVECKFKNKPNKWLRK